MIRPSAEIKAQIVADYQAGMSQKAVARKYNVSASSAHRYVHEAGVSRSVRAAQRAARQQAYDAEYGLNGGHWTPNRRGVVVWQPCFFDNPQTCNINHQETSHAA